MQFRGCLMCKIHWCPLIFFHEFFKFQGFIYVGDIFYKWGNCLRYLVNFLWTKHVYSHILLECNFFHWSSKQIWLHVSEKFSCHLIYVWISLIPVTMILKLVTGTWELLFDWLGFVFSRNLLPVWRCASSLLCDGDFYEFYQKIDMKIGDIPF